MKESERSGSVQAAVKILEFPSRVTLYRLYEPQKPVSNDYHGTLADTNKAAANTPFDKAPEHSLFSSVKIKMNAPLRYLFI
ncbi:hypothetical protein AALB39_20530 [Lachnospiraceae bacterium 54-53]